VVFFDIALEGDGQVEDLAEFRIYLPLVILVLGLGLQRLLKHDDPADLVQRVEHCGEVRQRVDTYQVDAPDVFLEQVDINEKHPIVEGYHEEGVQAADRVVALIVPDVH
jgi:hypothetical protein